MRKKNKILEHATRFLSYLYSCKQDKSSFYDFILLDSNKYSDEYSYTEGGEITFTVFGSDEKVGGFKIPDTPKEEIEVIGILRQHGYIETFDSESIERSGKPIELNKLTTKGRVVVEKGGKVKYPTWLRLFWIEHKKKALWAVLLGVLGLLFFLIKSFI